MEEDDTGEWWWWTVHPTRNFLSGVGWSNESYYYFRTDGAFCLFRRDLDVDRALPDSKTWCESTTWTFTNAPESTVTDYRGRGAVWIPNSVAPQPQVQAPSDRWSFASVKQQPTMILPHKLRIKKSSSLRINISLNFRPARSLGNMLLPKSV